MPRGQKSKLRAREKRRRDRAQSQGLKDAPAATAEEEAAALPSSSPDFGIGPSTSAVAGSLLVPPSVPATTSTAACVSCKRSDGGTKSHYKKNKNSSRASTCTVSPRQNLLTKKAAMLVQSLLCKLKMNEPLRKADMVKVVHKWYREQLPEILRKASVRLDLVFGLELKEVKPNSHSYTLVYSSDDTGDGSLSSAWRFPTRGILMLLLGVIFWRHNHALEEDIWEILNTWGIHDAQRHFIFGDPRKLITQDLVKGKYLEYRQVPNSDPPRFEFLWGSRAHAETSKMKVLEFWSKISGSAPSDFPCRYEEALRDEEERARATAATMAGTTSKCSGDSRATSGHYTQPE